MGVTYIQHRIVTGLHSNKLPKSKGKQDGKLHFTKSDILKIIYGVICVIYLYMICLLLAGAVETASSITNIEYKFHRAYDIGLCVANDWNSILNSATIVVIMKVYSRWHNDIVTWMLKKMTEDDDWLCLLNVQQALKAMSKFCYAIIQ